MTVVQQTSGGGGRSSGNLYDVLDLILDKGLVIDVFARVSLVGIELLTVDVRIVVASVDTYLRFAEACNRLDLTTSSKAQTLPEMVGSMTEKGAHGKSKGALSGAAEAITDTIRNGRSDDEDRQPARSRSSSSSSRSRRTKDKEGEE
ncbi:gas vesicle structural protein GvpA [Marinactinospora thermotolerans]|uniref:Gas vesicle protein A n=2 Tax=Marinactinospora thermotolerans TaxID=531310 RepID=A0A1T4P2A0_9ACTN|nr:gas vesicle structural protein GvpA [Marinactinospora thermotolerans]AET51871.1 putative gas vesicle synthesis protein [Marinactinospora thermotolerans]SJZ85532.1 Gas vesicle protein [Marinactinospora thermotolerans DSM 45154]